MEKNATYKTVQVFKVISTHISFICALLVIAGALNYTGKYKYETQIILILYSFIGFFPVLIYNRLLKSAENIETKMSKFLLVLKSILTLFALLIYELYVVFMAGMASMD